MAKRKQYSDDFIALNSDMLAALESEPRQKSASKWEAMFDDQLQAAGLSAFLTAQYKFDSESGYRFDYAIPDRMIAIEIDGGNRMAVISKRTGRPVAIGRHTQADDYRKLNFACIAGWKVLRFTPDMVKSGEALRVVSEVVLPF